MEEGVLFSLLSEINLYCCSFIIFYCTSTLFIRLFRSVSLDLIVFQQLLNILFENKVSLIYCYRRLVGAYDKQLSFLETLLSCYLSNCSWRRKLSTFLNACQFLSRYNANSLYNLFFYSYRELILSFNMGLFQFFERRAPVSWLKVLLRQSYCDSLLFYLLSSIFCSAKFLFYILVLLYSSYSCLYLLSRVTLCYEGAALERLLSSSNLIYFYYAFFILLLISQISMVVFLMIVRLTMSGLGERQGSWCCLFLPRFLIDFIINFYSIFHLYLLLIQISFPTTIQFLYLSISNIQLGSANICNNIYTILHMKSQLPIHNRIIPIKSLVQNNKQHNKKQYIQFADKETHNPSVQTTNTSKLIHHNQHYQLATHAQGESCGQFQTHGVKERVKGISIAKNYSITKGNRDHEKREIAQKIYKPYEEYYYTAKKQTNDRQQSGNPLKCVNFMSQGYKKQSVGGLTPRKLQIIQPEDNQSYRDMFNERRESVKSINLNKLSQDWPKGSFQLSDKFSNKLQDETWNVSKFDKIVVSERESHPIFKDELIKIKTQLFQKQACLFEVTQKLQERQNMVKQLCMRLQVAVDMNKNLKYKLNQLNSEIKGQEQKDINNKSLIQSYEIQKEKLLTTIERLTEQTNKLNQQLNRKRQNQRIQQQSHSTSTILMQLKLRQYECEQKEYAHYVMDLKQKDRKTVDSYEKILSVQKELLRQKEEQLYQISHTAEFYKDEASRNIKQLEEMKQKYKVEASGKEGVIRELSGQVGDLKNSIKNVEIQMRQLIENEQQLKKEIQIKRITQKDYQSQINQLIDTNSLLKDQIKKLQSSSNNTAVIYKDQDQNKHKQQKQKELEISTSLKDLQLSMIMRTCEQYKKKIEDYHKYSQQMRVSIQNFDKIQMQLKKSIYQKEVEIQRLKLKCGQSQEKKPSQKSYSPVKEGKIQDKQYIKLKNINFKLIKDNQGLGSIIKDLDFKLYQLYRVNEGLNETIMNLHLININSRISQQYQTQPEQNS